MTFLKGFKETMAADIQSSKEVLEKKIDGRLNDIDCEIKKINDKIYTTDEKASACSKRMDSRLNALEKEMARYGKIQRRNEELRNWGKNLDIQPAGRVMSKEKDSSDKPTKVIEDKQKEQTVSSQCTPFRSSWAQELEQELQGAAAVIVQPTRISSQLKDLHLKDCHVRHECTPITEARQESRDQYHEKNSYEPLIVENPDEPDAWENWGHRPSSSYQPLGHKTKTKVRKPLKITTWFGEETTSEESESEDTESWNEVDRKRKNQEKRRLLKRRKKEKEERVATKAAGMAGIGPIDINDATKHMNAGMNFEDAKVAALKDFLRENLGYDETELEELSIVETRFATKGEKILYVAMSKQDHVKELHVRRAESRNDSIRVRNYIPPNFFDRFMALNRICTERRAEDPWLKTQLRFGRADVEIFTKRKGGEAGYRLANLNDFIGQQQLPPFDHNIRWKKFIDHPPRITVTYKKTLEQDPLRIDRAASQPGGILLEGAASQPTGITRANSNTVNSNSKKIRVDSSSSDSSSDTESSDKMSIHD